MVLLKPLAYCVCSNQIYPSIPTVRQILIPNKYKLVRYLLKVMPTGALSCATFC
jgi:hypothetical protein